MIALHELRASGKSIRAIARETGLSRNTVRKYLRADGIPEHKARPKRPSKLDPFKPKLQEWMSEGIYNCVVLLERLRELGYEGGMTTPRVYVRVFRPPKRMPAVQRYETPAGKQAQVDWGFCEYLDEHGTAHKVAMYVMILGYSRMRYVEFTKRCDMHSFLRCMMNAFMYFGGIPKVVLTDRMKTVLLGMGDDSKPRWHPRFEDFAASFGFIPKVCRVRRPQTKGKVERLVHFVKQNFFPGRRFTDLGDLNRQARGWCDRVNRRTHGTTGEIPIQRLQEEGLKPLPPTERWEKLRYEVRRVSLDGFVSYDGALYGVNWRYSGREILVRELAGQVEIWVDGVCVERHRKQYQSRVFMPNEGQYVGLSTANGYPYPKPRAYQVPNDEVQVRPLEVYEQLAEVGI